MKILSANKYTVRKNELPIRVQIIELFLLSLTILLFYLAFPSTGIGHLSWIVMVPMLLAIQKKSNKRTFLITFITATFGWLVSIWWVVAGLVKITLSTTNIIVPLVFVFCLLSALPYAVAFLCYKKIGLKNNFLGAFFSALLFTVVINYSPQILPGNLAHALYLNPLHIQLADIGGVPLVFFVVHLVNFLLFNAIVLWQKSKSKAVHNVALAMLVFILNYGYGLLATQSTKFVQPDMPSYSFSLIQPNFSTSWRDRDSWLRHRNIVANLIKSTQMESNSDFVVMPELPVPVSYQFFDEDKQFFEPLVRDSTLLLTAIKPFNKTLSNHQGYYNSMEVIKNGVVKTTYLKQILLPFGEYLPFENKLPWLRDLLPNTPLYKAGIEPTVYTQVINDENITLMPLICYEAVFTDTAHASVGLGGDIFINSSNDAWFGSNEGARVHLALTLFRAIEFRKPIVRITNSGLSTVVLPSGEILEGSTMASDKATASKISIQPTNIITIYQQYPWLFKCVALFLLSLFILKKAILRKA